MDNLITGSTDNIAHLAGRRDFMFIHYDVTHYLYIEGPRTRCCTSPARKPDRYLNFRFRRLRSAAWDA